MSELYNEADDMELLCAILEDEDVIDDNCLYKSSDALVLWLVREMIERSFYPD